MKSIFTLFTCLLSTLAVYAQIANSSFENWYTDTTGKKRLNDWEHCVKYDFPGGGFGTWQENNAQSGTYALKLSRWYNYTWDVVR